MAGDSVWPRAGCSLVVSRGIVDLDRVDRCLHTGDDCGKSPRTRYHLWLFRSRQSKLELSFSFGDQSGDSRRLACTLVSEFEKVSVACLLTTTDELPCNPTRGTQFVCEYSRQHDQETEIREVSVVFAQEESENREAKKPRHVLDGSTGKETRTSRSVFQATLTRSETQG